VARDCDRQHSTGAALGIHRLLWSRTH